jgi:hypothetical protein
LWGRNQSGEILSDDYYQQVTQNGRHFWTGVKEAIRPNNEPWSATCNCAYTFVLDAWKRTIDGYRYILRGSSRQSVTINNTRRSCAGL